jgi:hypothetical protein
MKIGLLCGAMAASMMTSASFAAFVLVEDFESRTVNAAYPNSFNASGNNPVVNDTGSPFGTTGNKYLRFFDTAGSGGAGINNGLFNFSDNTMSSYAFDFIRTSANDATLAITNSTTVFSAGRWVSGVPTSSLTQNQLYTITFLFNRSGSSATYFNPVTNSNASLADDSWAVFAYDGTTTVSLGSSTGTPDVVPSRLSVYNGNVPHSALMDNIRASTSLEVLVPEPASLSLIGLAGVAALRRRRA